MRVHNRVLPRQQAERMVGQIVFGAEDPDVGIELNKAGSGLTLEQAADTILRIVEMAKHQAASLKP